MALALLLGVGLFSACWLLHVVIWRIRRPEAYPVWLAIIFLVVPGFLAGLRSFLPLPGETEVDLWTLLAALLLHAAISGTYMAGYVSVVGYSPSADRIGEHVALFGETAAREVAGEQDEVHLTLQRAERLARPLAVAVAAEVDVAGRRDPDPALVGLAAGAVSGVYRHPSWRVPTSRWTQTSSRSPTSSMPES